MQTRHYTRLRHTGPTGHRAILAAASGTASVAFGWLIAHDDLTIVVVALVLGALLILAARAPAVLAALLVLAALNGLPFLDLGGRLPGGMRFQDVAILALAALLFVFRDRSVRVQRSSVVQLSTIWGTLLVAWWTVAVARSVFLSGIPLLKAALFGRDFLYFAILLPLAVRVRFPPRSAKPAWVLLLTGLSACAIGQAVQGITGVSVTWLAHPSIVDPTSGVTRLYSDMAYLINTGLIFSAALLLSRDARGRRLPIGVLTALLLIDAALQLGRANYFALGVACSIAASVYLLSLRSAISAFLRICLAILLVTLSVLTIFSSAQVSGVPRVVVARLASGVSAVERSSGTVGYREQLDREMLHVLGNEWPIGLGFLHPAFHYVPGLPDGTIRNSDTGVFNALMTMGIIGVVLIYAPLLYGLHHLFRARARLLAAAAPFRRMALYGGLAWLGWALAGTPTLVLLFSTPGLLVAALVVASVLQVAGAADLGVDAAGVCLKAIPATSSVHP